MKIGKVTGSALKRSVLRPIAYRREEVQKGAAVGTDCAFFAIPQGYGMTSCVQEAAVAGKADVAFLVGRCANSLATAGSEPIAAMLCLNIPASWEEPQLKELMEQLEEACKSCRMQIAGGHTTVSEGLEQPFAAVTAYGRVPLDCPLLKRKGPAPGEDIVLSKWIGLEGTAMLAKKYKEALLQRYPAPFVQEAARFGEYQSVLPEAAIAAAEASYLHDASEGGILAALWEMAEHTGVGLEMDLRKLPIRQETVEVCELVGVNPYELRSGGCLIMTAADGEALVEKLDSAQIPAVVIGQITDKKERRIRNGEEIRYMDRPAVDEIYEKGK